MLRNYGWAYCLGAAVLVYLVYRWYSKPGPAEAKGGLAPTRRGPVGYGGGRPPYKGGSVQSHAEALRKLPRSGSVGPGKSACCGGCATGGGGCSS